MAPLLLVAISLSVTAMMVMDYFILTGGGMVQVTDSLYYLCSIRMSVVSEAEQPRMDIHMGNGLW